MLIAQRVKGRSLSGVVLSPGWPSTASTIATLGRVKSAPVRVLFMCLEWENEEFDCALTGFDFTVFLDNTISLMRYHSQNIEWAGGNRASKAPPGAARRFVQPTAHSIVRET